MKKHAYLIAAHNEFEVLKKLIMLLDYEDNDIYIHIDKGTPNFDESSIMEIVHHSTVRFVDACKVNWGGYSQIQYEMNLLKEAVKIEHEYYHLISGVDLPIKSHDYIMKFFEENKGKEFIEFDNEYDEALKEYRVRYHHILQDRVGKRTDAVGKILYNIERVIVKSQKLAGVNRIKGSAEKIYKGTNWFSITHDLASYIVEKEEEIKERYKDTFCADEVFLHTMVMNSRFKDNIVDDCLRYIDWDRGQPYVFTDEDYSLLINSDKLWARKFSASKDMTIINHIYDTFKRDK